MTTFLWLNYSPYSAGLYTNIERVYVVGTCFPPCHQIHWTIFSSLLETGAPLWHLWTLLLLLPSNGESQVGRSAAIAYRGKGCFSLAVPKWGRSTSFRLTRHVKLSPCSSRAFNNVSGWDESQRQNSVNLACVHELGSASHELIFGKSCPFLCIHLTYFNAVSLSSQLEFYSFNFSHSFIAGFPWQTLIPLCQVNYLQDSWELKGKAKIITINNFKNALCFVLLPRTL